jgi:hypothetical protein
MRPDAGFIFISYSRKDKAFVQRLTGDLQRHGVAVWIDQEGLKAGSPDWEYAVRKAIRASRGVVLVASPASAGSDYVRDELRIAAMYKRQVIPVWASGRRWMDCIPMGQGGRQRIDARGAQFEAGLEQLLVALGTVVREPEMRPATSQMSSFTPRNPYKGLRSFGQADVGDFFGRDREVDELLQYLRRALLAVEHRARTPRLLAVLGPSGSGKSSLIQAGVLPRLRAGGLPASNRWKYIEPLVPGTHPVESLTVALGKALPERSLKSIREDLRDEGTRGLHLLATSLTHDSDEKVLLAIDQFEEAFTLTTDEAERTWFIELLLTAVTESRGPVVALVALRADFYDRPLQYAELGRLIHQHHIPVVPMDVENLRAVIERPAALPDVQVTFEGNLVGDLLFEMRGQAGALPLLQFTLDQLFERREGSVLTLASYQEIGGVRGALARHAEAIYDSLPTEDHKRLTQALFLRLIDPGATEQDTTRRRAAFSELSLVDKAETAVLHEVADIFITARLLTANEVGGTKTIEVSHEALIREWARLTEWVREARDDVRLQKRISSDATEWLERGRPEYRLYRGAGLGEAQHGKRQRGSVP